MSEHKNRLTPTTWVGYAIPPQSCTCFKMRNPRCPVHGGIVLKAPHA